MSAAAGDLTTLANVKAYLRLTVATDDALLQRLITAASAWIKTFINRDILQAVYVETVDGTGTPRQCFPNYPITAVTAISVRDGLPIDVADVTFNAGTITRTDGGSFPRGLANLTFTYTAGFPTVPDDIEECAILMVALRYREKDRVGTNSVNVKGESVTFSAVDVPASVKTILRNWRNVVPC